MRNIWFPALKAQTDGDNWTIKTFNDLLGRNADNPPFFEKGYASSAYQQDSKSLEPLIKNSDLAPAPSSRLYADKAYKSKADDELLKQEK